ncbi:hypothetical protein GT352_00975, partial [Streptomyces sp. SID1046]|uniref:hypothetical protein n=1 Tax=Streptomyces sp. SID1046 TaxID=2690249 RepID=UPI00136D763F
VRVIGAFNPTDAADRVTGSDTGGGWTLDLPARSAAVLVTRDGALLGWLATPEEPSATPVALVWGGEQADATCVRAS